jgi:hypothetical protein
MRRLLVLVAVVAMVLVPTGSHAMSTDGHRAVATSADAAGEVAFLGCSNTKLNVEGVHTVHPGAAWWPAYNTGGGDLPEWSTETKYWQRFDSTKAANPVISKVWFQMCNRNLTQTDAWVYSKAADALSLLRLRVGPDVPVYVSAIEASTDDKCKNGDAARMNVIADQLVAAGLALRGPVLSALIPGVTRNEKNCHPNAQGQQIHGQELFDALGG